MRILVVEDEKRIRDLVKKSLETECYAVDEAEDGQQAYDLAVMHDYDLIVLDNLLPNKKGIDICRDLRAKGKSVPIIILSVKTEIFTKVELLNAGADDYLGKPFSFDELLARIQAVLRRPKHVDSEVLSADNDNLVLDSKRHKLVHNGEEIYLSRKEFMLLDYLMRNPGIVLSRGMLLEHVWDMNTDPFSNTIESYIMSLRKKLEKGKKVKLIHTIPGRGYKFEPKPEIA